MTDTTNPQAEPETAHALLRRHGLPEDVIDGAFCLHAQELAAQQRAHADAEPGEPGCWHDGAHCVADLIDPTKAAAASVPASAPTEEAPAPTAWVYEQVCTALDAHRQQAEVRRLALAAALRLDTGAPWDAIRARVAELADAVPVSGPGGAADETQADPAAEELTAEEARALVDQMGLDLYRAQDAIEFARECCDIADREQRPVTTVDVREWLKGDRCTRQRAADEQPDAVSQPAVAPPVEHCIHDRTVHRTHHTAPVTGCPWCTTASAAGDPS